MAAVKSAFIGTLWALVLAQTLILCVPLASAGRDPLGPISEKIFSKSFSSISDLKLGRTTLSVPGGTSSPSTSTLEDKLQNAISSLQSTIKTIFVPVAIPLPLRFLDISIDKVNNVTREALDLAVKDLQDTLEFIFFPILSIPTTLSAKDHFIESAQITSIEDLEDSIRSLENLLQLIFYPFVAIADTGNLLQESTFAFLENSIHFLDGTMRAIFYPFLNIPGLNLNQLSEKAESVEEAQLRSAEFLTRSVEECLKIILFPVLPSTVKNTLELEQNITFKALEKSVHALHKTFRTVFSPFLNVPKFLQPVNNFIEYEQALTVNAVDRTIKVVQDILRNVFVPFASLPDAVEKLENFLNGNIPGAGNYVIGNIQTLNNILLHIFLPSAPSPPSPPSPKTLSPITYLQNVLKSLLDTLERILVPYASSAPPTSLLDYLKNDLEGLQNTVQNLLLPFTVRPSPPPPPPFFR